MTDKLAKCPKLHRTLTAAAEAAGVDGPPELPKPKDKLEKYTHKLDQYMDDGEVQQPAVKQSRNAYTVVTSIWRNGDPVPLCIHWAEKCRGEQ